MISNTLRQVWERHSDTVWVVTAIHFLWGYVFLTYDNLPRPFGGIHPFADEYQELWGVCFILAAILSIISDFVSKTWYKILLIPQQMVLTYAAIATLISLTPDNTRLLLAAGYTVPLAIGHLIATLRR